MLSTVTTRTATCCFCNIGGANPRRWAQLLCALSIPEQTLLPDGKLKLPHTNIPPADSTHLIQVGSYDRHVAYWVQSSRSQSLKAGADGSS